MGNAGKWIVLDRSKSGMASGIGMTKLLSAMDKAVLGYEARHAWSDALPEKMRIPLPCANIGEISIHVDLSDT